MQNVHIESYRENGLFFFYYPFPADKCRLVPTKVYDCFADVVLWFPPILSRLEYPMRPELSCPKLENTTAWAVFRRTNSQVNTLHSCSFLCLAVSAASFAYRWVWPARAALAIPFLLSAAQGLKPDSPESLAVRLWEERVTQGFTTSGIDSKIKCHVVLSDVTHEKMFAVQQFVASMLFASILSRRRQELQTHEAALQRGEPVEVNAETGLKAAGQLLPQWAC